MPTNNAILVKIRDLENSAFLVWVTVTHTTIDRVDGIAGFFGASSIERFATEKGIKEQWERFKDSKKK